MISACVRVNTLAPGDLDEAAQPVGTSEQTADVDRCLLGRIVPRCLKPHGPVLDHLLRPPVGVAHPRRAGARRRISSSDAVFADTFALVEAGPLPTVPGPFVGAAVAGAGLPLEVVEPPQAGQAEDKGGLGSTQTGRTGRRSRTVRGSRAAGLVMTFKLVEAGRAPALTCEDHICVGYLCFPR
jgi:hypothetical protein